MDQYIPISYINDFIFCPRSIYNHILYGNFDEMLYQDTPQKKGKNIHKTIDTNKYSDKKNILQNYEVYSTEFGLYGKIDTFDLEKGILMERKNNIKTIYDGYIFLVYAYFFGLSEQGYDVREIYLYDYSKNKKFRIDLPMVKPTMFQKFKDTLDEIRYFSLLRKNFVANENKCKKCIYNLLCDKSQC